MPPYMTQGDVGGLTPPKKPKRKKPKANKKRRR